MNERGKHAVIAIFVIWITVFSIFVGSVWVSQRNTINDLKKTKANLAQIQKLTTKLHKTDCGLQKFLISARSRLVVAMKSDTPSKLKRDRNSLKTYKRLIDNFTSCPTGGKLD